MANLSMTHGDTRLFDLAVTSDGVAVNLTGGSLAFTARYKEADAATIIAKTSPSGGIVIGNPATAGLAVLTISPADTAALVRSYDVRLVYDLQFTDAASNVYTVDSGTLTIHPDVTWTP